MNWIVPLMGFTESVSRRTGMESLWSELRLMASPSTTVLMPWEWRDDMRSLAEFIARNSIGRAPRVMVVAYSWGAGYAFPRFARACGERGIEIDAACLCDPVYRSRWLPWWIPLNPMSLMRGAKIGIPGNVRRVAWVRQEISVPSGHELVAENPEATEILPARLVLSSHEHIDESQAFRVLALAEAKTFVEGAR